MFKRYTKRINIVNKIREKIRMQKYEVKTNFLHKGNKS